MSVSSWAYDVEIDGIYYNLINKANIAEVTSGDYKYKGTVVIPSSIVHEGNTYIVTSIAESAFYQCCELANITIPSSITSIIGKTVFYGCKGLTSVNITDLAVWCNIGFSDAASNPLYYAHKLLINEEEIKDIIIPISVKSIAERTFIGCTSIHSLNIPNSVNSISRGAFMGCSNLRSVVLPQSVSVIPEEAFYGCSNLPFIYLPESITDIGSSAFGACISLSSINLPNSLAHISDRIFYGCTSLTDASIPNTIRTISSHAFQLCTNLRSITIPNSVTHLFDYAFDGCNSLSDIIIPNSVSYIGEGVFRGCYNIETIKCYATETPTVGKESFMGAYIEHATLMVPESTIQTYSTTPPWSSFGTIIPLDDTPVETIKNNIIKNGKKVFNNRKVVIKKAGKIYSVDGKPIILTNIE